MYQGYMGAALAAKRLDHRLSLLVLLVAAVGFDLFPIAHWLPVGVVVASLVFLIGRRRWGDPRMAMVLALLCFAHVILDLATGVQLLPGTSYVGLVDHVSAFRLVDFGIETTIVVVGWQLYRGTLSDETRTSAPVFLMLGFMVSTQALFDIFYVRRTTEYASSGDALRLLRALGFLALTIVVLVRADRSLRARDVPVTLP